MELKKSEFLKRFIECNGLHKQHFNRWLFYPGMLFKSTRTWWGTGGERSKPHEGIDVCFYRDRSGNQKHLGSLARIPVIYRGVVVQIIDDYLGSSVFVAHDMDDGKGNRLYTIYGHVEKLARVRIGIVLESNEIMATVSGARRRNAPVTSHLHLTVALIPDMHPPAELNWKTLQSFDVKLLDPLTLLECTYELLGER